MSSDFATIISVIIALCAIISPIFTSFINNNHQKYLKKLELSEQRYQDTVLYKQKIFENYLKYAGRCIMHATGESVKDYGEYYLIALMYAPNEIQEEMIKIHDKINNRNWNDATNLLEQLTPMITNMLQKL